MALEHLDVHKQKKKKKKKSTETQNLRLLQKLTPQEQI